MGTGSPLTPCSLADFCPTPTLNEIKKGQGHASRSCPQKSTMRTSTSTHAIRRTSNSKHPTDDMLTQRALGLEPCSRPMASANILVATTSVRGTNTTGGCWSFLGEAALPPGYGVPFDPRKRISAVFSAPRALYLSSVGRSHMGRPEAVTSSGGNSPDRHFLRTVCLLMPRKLAAFVAENFVSVLVTKLQLLSKEKNQQTI